MALTRLPAADPIQAPAVDLTQLLAADRMEAAEEVRAGVLVPGEVIAVVEVVAAEALPRLLRREAAPAGAGDTEFIALEP